MKDQLDQTFEQSAYEVAQYIRNAGDHELADRILFKSGLLIGMRAQVAKIPGDKYIEPDSSFDQPEPRVKRKYVRRKK